MDSLSSEYKIKNDIMLLYDIIKYDINIINLKPKRGEIKCK